MSRVNDVSGTPQDKVLVRDLTLEESSPEEDKPTKQGKFKMYFDQHRGKVVKAWEDGFSGGGCN